MKGYSTPAIPGVSLADEDCVSYPGDWVGGGGLLPCRGGSRYILNPTNRAMYMWSVRGWKEMECVAGSQAINFYRSSVVIKKKKLNNYLLSVYGRVCVKPDVE